MKNTRQITLALKKAKEELLIKAEITTLEELENIVNKLTNFGIETAIKSITTEKVEKPKKILVNEIKKDADVTAKPVETKEERLTRKRLAREMRKQQQALLDSGQQTVPQTVAQTG